MPSRLHMDALCTADTRIFFTHSAF
jgi:hypothetical protein